MALKKGKARTTKAAGKTAKVTTPRPMPKTAEGWARAINAREKQEPGFFRSVVSLLKFTTAPVNELRVAQVEPRATH